MRIAEMIREPSSGNTTAIATLGPEIVSTISSRGLHETLCPIVCKKRLTDNTLCSFLRYDIIKRLSVPGTHFALDAV